MALGVGIHENVFLQEAKMDDSKATIILVFEECSKANAGPKKSYFEMAASSEVEEVEKGTQVMLFPPTPPKEDSKLTKEKQLQNLVGDINKVKGICLHILSGYYTTEDLKDKMQPFAGLPMDNTNFETEIFRKEILEQVQRNIGRTFIQLITPFLNKPEMKFRLLLVRQSTDKHFATLRGHFLNDNPFWESMDVPKEASKVAFTKWEKDNKFDSGEPVPKPAAGTTPGATTAPGAAPVSAANIFGPR